MPFRSSARRPEARRARSVLVAHPSAELYGSDRVLLESVQALVGAGWRVVVTVPAPGPLVPELEARGATVVRCPTPVLRKSALTARGFGGFLADVLRSLGPATRLVWRHGTDGVYVNTVTIPLWLLLGRLLGRRVTGHVHEAEASASRLLRTLIALPLLLASRVVVNSTFSLEVLTAAVPGLRGRSTVVYNGVLGPAQVVPARARLASPVVVLFLGRLSPRKGPQVAVAAARLLSERGVEVRLDLLGAVYAGYEWFEAELHAAVRAAALECRVRFLGFDADVWPHLGEADVVVVPSVVDEPFGNTAVEAVLAGRPLVASATSGLLEAAAGYAGVQSVTPDRPDLLADAVQRVVADWDRYRELADRDRSLAQERHSVRRYRQQIVRIVSGEG
jgi:glycosyltransferase involved in cell wall biosynthesis